jgi:hypothetical protein
MSKCRGYGFDSFWFNCAHRDRAYNPMSPFFLDWDVDWLLNFLKTNPVNTIKRIVVFGFKKWLAG